MSVLGSRSMKVKKSKFINPLNYCITQCTYTPFFITQIQMLYNCAIVTLCDQYRVSTTLYKCKDITHICAAIHVHNWSYWYCREINFHDGVNVIVLGKGDGSITMHPTCAMYWEDQWKLLWLWDKILTAHPARLASFFRLFVSGLSSTSEICWLVGG